MKVVKSKITFEDYLKWDDGTDKVYELINGELVELPPESRLNSHISFFLGLQIAKIIPYRRICHKDTEIEVSGTLTTTRLPDLMVLSNELSELLGRRRGTITRDMPPPLLVIEVVSPGKANEDRDYRYKRSEYAARGIQEYWVIDPVQELVTVFSLVDGLYEAIEFCGDDVIISQILAELNLTPTQIFQQ